MPPAITPKGDVCATIIAANASLRDRALFEVAEKIIGCNYVPYNDWIGERQLYAGQRLGNPGMVRTAWKCLINVYRQSQHLPGTGKWYLFAEAAKDVGLQAYYYQQMQDYIQKHEIPKRANNTMPDPRADSDRTPWSEADQLSIRAFCREVASRLESLEKTNFSLRNREKAPASTLIWKGAEVPQEWQYTLYNEFSIDKDEAPWMTTVIYSNMVSRSGISFEELRCLYWKSISNLLIQAGNFELRAN
ncbi:hypothetical protein N7G274_007523 [Stereocaulon virgatum]|uniref:Uncharacterized protein n=1 Tax=Stereocaulon virgatum TaxID=373712 RepID=A0ABR4A4K2_9LECA